jgi:hypothetical protein
VRPSRATFRDFHYPTRWQHDRFDRPLYRRPPERTLVASGVFRVTHVSGRAFDAVLSRWRADRAFAWIVLARVPAGHSGFLDSLPYARWMGYADGHAEVALTKVDAGLDHPYDSGFWRHPGLHGCEMWRQPSAPWNVWLAAAIGLRAGGFSVPPRVCPGRHRPA